MTMYASPDSGPSGIPAPVPGKRTLRAGKLPHELWGVLRSTPRVIAVYRLRRLDPALREGIMAAVSQVNACRYCTVAHEAWEARLRSEAGVSGPTGGGPERSDESHHFALAYATARAEAHPRVVVPELESAMGRHFDERERRDLDAVIRLAMFTNLTMNSLEALRNRMRRSGRHHGRR